MNDMGKKNYGLAIVSFIFGIIAIFYGWLPVIGWIIFILAIILGFVSLHRIKKDPTLKGGWLAIAGIILGFISLFIAILWSLVGVFLIGSVWNIASREPLVGANSNQVVCNNAEYQTTKSGGYNWGKVVLDYKSSDKLSKRIEQSGDSALKEIEDLSCLEYLSLDKRNIKDISSLGNLKNLIYLDLSGNIIEDVSPLQGMNRLQILYLGFMNIKDISPLRNLVELRELNLASTMVSDASPLSGMVNLQTLYLSTTQITDISPLRNMVNLEALYLHSTGIKDISYLKNMKKLKKLTISYTLVDDISTLSGLPIEELDISHTQVTDISPLLTLRELRRLQIRGSPLSESQISKIKQLKSVTAIDLEGSITESQCKDIKNSLPYASIHFEFNKESC